MSKIILGIDPDSKAHGVAFYFDGELTNLESMTLFELYEDIEQNIQHLGDVVIHIEDVCSMNAVFRQRQTQNQAINMKMANSIGKCQQSQVELERMAKVIGVKVVKHKISKTWKNQTGKAQFEKVTGWTGRSNEDTRSAAYFGWLGCK